MAMVTAIGSGQSALVGEAWPIHWLTVCAQWKVAGGSGGGDQPNSRRNALVRERQLTGWGYIKGLTRGG